MNWNTMSWSDYNAFTLDDWNILTWQGTPTPVGPGTVKTTLSLGIGI